MPRFAPRLAAVLAAISLALAGCGSGEPEAIEVVAIGSDGAGIDNPVRGALSFPEQVAMTAMAQGLVRIDAQGEVIPGLAERWNVTDDGLSYIFRLGPGEWPDGREINARDVARHLKRQIARSSANELNDSLGAVEDIVAMTDRVIEIRLAAPRPNLLYLLAQPEMAVLRNGQGTGPFTRLKNTSLEAGIIALTYREQITDAPDIVERVNLRSAPAEKAIQMFADGEASVVLGGKFFDLPLVREADVTEKAVRFDPAIGLFGLAPARRTGPAADPELRRLLSRALHRSALIEALDVPNLVPRSTILQAGLDGIADPVATWEPIATDNSRDAALVSAGRAMFGDATPPTIAIDIPEGPGGDLLLNRLAGDWGVMGIEVVRAGSGRQGDFRLVDLVAPSSSPAWFVRRFRCGIAVVCLAEADRLMDEARTATDPVERVRLIEEAARLLEEKTVFIPIAAPIRWSLVADGLPGFIENQAARHTLVGLARKPNAEGRR